MSYFEQLLTGSILRTGLEFIATVLGTVYLLLIAQKKASAWLLGTLSCIIFAGLCFESHLVYQGIIQTFNVIMGVYAWLHWKKGIEPVRSMPSIGILSLISFPILLLLSRLIQKAEDWTVSLDQVALLYSVVATYLTFRLIEENWHLWLLVNAVTAYTAWVNGFAFYAGMSLIYVLMSIYGLLKWKRT